MFTMRAIEIENRVTFCKDFGPLDCWILPDNEAFSKFMCFLSIRYWNTIKFLSRTEHCDQILACFLSHTGILLIVEYKDNEAFSNFMCCNYL